MYKHMYMQLTRDTKVHILFPLIFYNITYIYSFLKQPRIASTFYKN